MNPELTKKFQEAEAAIKESKHIVIAGHESPDGDSLGSMLALHYAIQENMGIKTYPFLAEDIPPSLKFLTAQSTFISELDWHPDLVIGVDYGDFHRLNLPEDKIESAKIITFDHHPPSRQRGDITIIDTSVSSTAELIYDFFNTVGWDISSRSALCVLTGILTDTGAFSHQTSPRTLRTAGELIEKGAPLHDIYLHTFADKPSAVLNAWGDFLQNIEINERYGYAGIFIPYEEFEKYGIVLDDLDGLKSILNMVQEADFSVLAIEHERGKIKGSFRSDKFSEVDVSGMAKNLGGGGHRYAAGFSFEAKNLEDAKRVIENAVAKEFSAKEVK